MNVSGEVFGILDVVVVVGGTNGVHQQTHLFIAPSSAPPVNITYTLLYFVPPLIFCCFIWLLCMWMDMLKTVSATYAAKTWMLCVYCFDSSFGHKSNLLLAVLPFGNSACNGSLINNMGKGFKYTDNNYQLLVIA